MSFNVSGDVLESVKKVEECVAGIREWMKNNMLRLNNEKTKVLVISTPFSLIGYQRLISELMMLVFNLVSQHVALM